MWFSEQFDFLIADALAKLERFGVVKSDDGQHIALSVSAAQLQLNTKWDGLFNFSKCRQPIFWSHFPIKCGAFVASSKN
jgi:hypothetical protein